ncbi:MAG TPA: hypothetical protein DCY49_03340 [Candidatus Jacksonbacteria bacterium]|uniref:Uncharacterized protein n=1 Tax=candidate division CPR1 bacterium GW2011_GWA2_42_17 TaxID=1618341 RepID=A0A0G0Z6M9_9BACT|nr:MAG: hypothetical protein UV05_C0007G0004 [candidate division CPR1 bacterium GW2011_GWA2_42_17]OGY71023.1 MAG: hypothetical protein A2986_00915 [Candidatus Jacksonbacteria bacterium RIFCSPLOWO2_01_FULL_44_13]HAZ16910.1 hypothetical protein [Candidatus Jacksonbacteria bacterium]
MLISFYPEVIMAQYLAPPSNEHEQEPTIAQQSFLSCLLVACDMCGSEIPRIETPTHRYIPLGPHITYDGPDEGEDDEREPMGQEKTQHCDILC